MIIYNIRDHFEQVTSQNAHQDSHSWAISSLFCLKFNGGTDFPFDSRSNLINVLFGLLYQINTIKLVTFPKNLQKLRGERMLALDTTLMVEKGGKILSISSRT